MSLHNAKLVSLKDRHAQIEAERLEKLVAKLEIRDEEKKKEIKKKAKKK